MNRAHELSGAELDIAVAIALGASKGKTATENVIACGTPLTFRSNMFVLVNAASVSVRWRPTVDWSQGGPLLGLLVENGYVLLKAPTEPVGLLKGGNLIEGADVLEATCRAVVEMFSKKETA
jgi:hypothetical protein